MVVIVKDAKFTETDSWKPRYQRNNKCGGFKNIRCFPRCSTPHRNKGFCGHLLALSVEYETLKGATCHHLSAWGGFRPVDQDPFFTLDTLVDLRKIEIAEQNSHDPTRRWFYGHESISTTEENKVTFEFNKRKKGWNYNWVASKHTINVQHVFEVYLFAPMNLNQPSIHRVVGVIQTPSFVLYSRKCPGSDPPSPLPQSSSLSTLKGNNFINPFETPDGEYAPRGRKRSRAQVSDSHFQSGMDTYSMNHSSLGGLRDTSQMHASTFEQQCMPPSNSLIAAEAQIQAHLHVVILTIERLEAVWRSENEMQGQENKQPFSSQAQADGSFFGEMTRAMVEELMKDGNNLDTLSAESQDMPLASPGPSIDDSVTTTSTDDHTLYPQSSHLKPALQSTISKPAKVPKASNMENPWVLQDTKVSKSDLLKVPLELTNMSSIASSMGSSEVFSNSNPVSRLLDIPQLEASEAHQKSHMQHQKAVRDLAHFILEEKGLTQSLMDSLARCPKGTSRAALIQRKAAIVKAVEGHIGMFLNSYGIEYAEFAKWLANWKSTQFDWRGCEQRVEMKLRVLDSVLVHFGQLQEFQEQSDSEFNSAIPSSLYIMQPGCNLTGNWICDDTIIQAFESVRMFRGIPWVVRKMLRCIEQNVEVRHVPGKILVRTNRKLFSGGYYVYHLDGETHPWPTAPPIPFTKPLALSSIAWVEPNRVVTVHVYNATQRSVRTYRRESFTSMKISISYQERFEDDFSLSFGPWTTVLHRVGWATLNQTKKE